MLIGSAHNNKKFDNFFAIRVGNDFIRRTHVTKYLSLRTDYYFPLGGGMAIFRRQEIF